ncbi:lysophospholipase L1-like esterase [Glaciihabitans tibetensis]|uniref:Lysophospholipase L1-like esterase n=1 Tax=Glaciihabitans tibetensis TaxID=1266600 RepID=A0A2T0VB92_9MICO|nr:SGNH/GDSL hydrolase family protein [Glaciihabitans tibetensis]PRY67450.1 lysophospholipase L1-like esterase [Glaciihabitans tibetensis]
MKWIYSGLAAATLALGGASYARYLHRRREVWNERLANAIPVNSKWWKDYHLRDGDILYAAIGDSTAQGIGASKPGRSYVGELAKHMRKVTGKTVKVANFAVSGSTVRGALLQQLPKLRKIQPDIVTVSIGANNMADFNAEVFENDLQRLFDGLPEHAIIADLPSFYFLPAEKNVIIANEIVHRLASRFHFPVVPLYARTKRQGLWGVSTQFAGDLFHPNDRGYAVWAAAFIPTLDVALQSLAREVMAHDAEPVAGSGAVAEGNAVAEGSAIAEGSAEGSADGRTDDNPPAH